MEDGNKFINGCKPNIGLNPFKYQLIRHIGIKLMQQKLGIITDEGKYVNLLNRRTDQHRKQRTDSWTQSSTSSVNLIGSSAEASRHTHTKYTHHTTHTHTNTPQQTHTHTVPTLRAM